MSQDMIQNENFVSECLAPPPPDAAERGDTRAQLMESHAGTCAIRARLGKPLAEGTANRPSFNPNGVLDTFAARLGRAA